MLADLCDLRVSLSTYKASGIGSKRFTRVALPRMKDRRGWEKFCFGEAASSVTSADSDEEGNEQRYFDVRPAGWTPQTRLLLQFDAVMTQAVLSHHVAWLEVLPRLNEARALWIYALLAHLEKPLHRDVEAVIRRLFLRLAALRASLPSGSDQELTLLQILIVVAGRYFGQVSFSSRFGTVNRNVLAQAAPSEMDGLALATALQPKMPPETEVQDHNVDLVAE